MALNTPCITRDIFWQYGDTLTSGKQADGANTIYYGTSSYATLVTSMFLILRVTGGVGKCKVL